MWKPKKNDSVVMRRDLIIGTCSSPRAAPSEEVMDGRMDLHLARKLEAAMMTTASTT